MIKNDLSDITASYKDFNKKQAKELAKSREDLKKEKA